MNVWCMYVCGYIFIKFIGFADGLDVRGKLKSRIIIGFGSCAMYNDCVIYQYKENWRKNIYEGEN